MSLALIIFDSSNWSFWLYMLSYLCCCRGYCFDVSLNRIDVHTCCPVCNMHLTTSPHRQNCVQDSVSPRQVGTIPPVAITLAASFSTGTRNLSPSMILTFANWLESSAQGDSCGMWDYSTVPFCRHGSAFNIAEGLWTWTGLQFF